MECDIMEESAKDTCRPWLLSDNEKWLLEKITLLERRIFDLERGYKP